jgi:hypothetical protein
LSRILDKVWRAFCGTGDGAAAVSYGNRQYAVGVGGHIIRHTGSDSLEAFRSREGGCVYEDEAILPRLVLFHGMLYTVFSEPKPSGVR